MSPSNTMSPVLRPTFVPSGILIRPAVWPQQTRAENWGGAVMPHFFWGGAGSLSYTMWSGPRPTLVPSDILIHPAVWPQYTWAENWGPPFLGGRGSWVPIAHNVAWVEGYLRTNWHLNPSSRLVTRYMSRKLEAFLLFGGSGSPSNTM